MTVAAQFPKNEQTVPFGVSLVQPASLQEGLAVYDQGQGSPILLMPYPHGYTLGSMSQSGLSAVLQRAGRRVITFDPPGAYQSTRSPHLTMQEMLEAAVEALLHQGITEPVDVVGHSMGSLCALAFSLYLPQKVRSMVLIGAASGAPALLEHGMPRCWSWWSREFWQYAVWGLILSSGFGSLALHKRHHQLINQASFVCQECIPAIPIEAGDEKRPAPLRDRWAQTVRKLDFRPFLNKINTRTLLCVGRFDPQTPVACSEELAEGLPHARLVLFENSGHSPFLEEPEQFCRRLTFFLR